MMETKGTGWVPDYPDLRDITLGHEVVNRLVRQVQGVQQVQGTQVPGSLDSQKDEIMSLFRELINVQSIDKTSELVIRLRNLEDSLSTNKLILATAKTTPEELYLPFLMSDKILQKDLSGREVAQLQEILKKLKIYEHPITGYFCDMTKQAIEKFQKDTGIKVDGIVGWQTRAKLLEKQLEGEHVKNMPSNISDPSEFNQIFREIITKFLPDSEDLFNQINQVKQDNSKLDLYQDYLILTANFRELIDPIFQVIAQITSPLGAHNNLEKVLDDGVKIFKELIKKDENPDSQLIDSETKITKTDYQYLVKLVRELVNKDKQNELQLTKLEAKIANEDYQYLAEIAIDKVIDQSDKFGERVRDIVDRHSQKYPDVVKLNELWESCKNLKQSIPQKEGSQASPDREKYWATLNKYRASLNKVYIEIESNESESNSSNQSTNELENPVIKVPILRKTLEEISGRFTADMKLQISSKSASSIQEERKKVYIALPEFVDLSLGCSPIKDQGSLNSCTAHVGITLIEYFVKKSYKKSINASRLFLYKVTRNLMHVAGNVGTSIRETMKAMALFGVPPEEYWPYKEDKVDEEPPGFCYGFAQNYQTLQYFRLDYPGISRYVLLPQIKAILVAGFPCAFGFTLYSSIYDNSNLRGHIPFPHKDDKSKGGHCVVAVGYDDYKVIENADGYESVGALLIRNSWGTDWGEGGYGWLPYDYVLKGLTADWWSLLQAEWFDTGEFGLGANDWTSNVGKERPGKSTNND